MKLKHMIAAALLLVLSLPVTAITSQDVQYRLAHANGQGTLKVGQEQFKVSGVIVKLLDDRKAEITLISDITVFLSGTWSQNAESKEEFDLQITGGASPGGLEAAGKVTLSSDMRLTLKGKSRTTKKTIEVNFTGTGK
jgi:hypothetical protein